MILRRTIRARRACVFAAVALLVGGEVAVADDGCEVLQRDSTVAVRTGDWNAAQSAHRNLAREIADGRCDQAFLAWLGERIAMHLYDEVVAGDDPQAEAQLEKIGESYGRPWLLSYGLAEFAAARGDWAVAAERYQQAMATVQDLITTAEKDRTEQNFKAVPSPRDRADLQAKAEQASLLSPHYVEVPTNRDGDFAGLGGRGITLNFSSGSPAASSSSTLPPTTKPGKPNVSGAKKREAQSVRLKVEFEFDSDTFTTDGKKAARQMAQILARQQSALSGVVLTGHTDPRGSDAYNLALSKRRAEALKRFLATNESHPISVPIDTVGKDSREPLAPVFSGLSREQLYQLDRRVEFERRGK